jgi:L-amino acid N-acyltransferase YncA
MSIIFESMTTERLSFVRELYNYYVRTSTATFHMHELSDEEMTGLVFFDDPRHCSFIIEIDDVPCGYATLRPFNLSREGYRNTAEVSVYLLPELIGRGIGRIAVEFLEKKARETDLHVLVASICAENAASSRLFERCGFVRCAHYREVGNKFGRLLDVVDLQKIIG